MCLLLLLLSYSYIDYITNISISFNFAIRKATIFTMPHILKPARRRDGDVTAPELPRTLTTPEMHHPAAEGCIPRSYRHCDHQAAAKRFGERFIAIGNSVTWPPRSPNLTPPGFCLWSHVKKGSYKREP